MACWIRVTNLEILEMMKVLVDQIGEFEWTTTQLGVGLSSRHINLLQLPHTSFTILFHLLIYSRYRSQKVLEPQAELYESL